ncbi:9-O-acetyl-N-acetylneuraminate esterase [Brunnivagina elsteri CCALA 953]|uniref:9-O-acetyl-N-acetylneuraminate esterase n=2 Tax=Brunnivagina TaxID=3344733 RepID=A0A2A2TCI0_9CYAN|nr:9-O-acetyl-N-acetylneuraminate esterase [Calothrix elsteri CCALA 953]
MVLVPVGGVAINGMALVLLVVVMASGALVLIFLRLRIAPNKPEEPEPTPEQTVSTQTVSTEVVTERRIYRQTELNRIIASLLANGSLLIAGEEGCGKSVLASVVVEKLQEDGFVVAHIEPTTPKQMLVEIAYQLGVETQSLEGKALSAEQLKRAIANYLENNTGFLVIDDVQVCEVKFRMWLKQLRKLNVPMLLLATNPPRNDIFINIPRIELQPLPEYAIRELMEQAALERGISLKPSDLSKLQERAGGNPMLAIRAIDEEYLGLEVEGADHDRYFDITPLILLMGIVFVVMRFIGLGTNNQALYIFGGIAAAVFLGVGRLLYTLPRESRRIR